MALQVLLNGQTRKFEELSGSASLADVVNALELKPDRVAIEHNGAIVPRSTWQTHGIAEGDKLEVVHFVGGGSGCAALRL